MSIGIFITLGTITGCSGGVIRDVATQKVVTSITNPVDKDFGKLTTEPDTSTDEELLQWLPHSKVIMVTVYCCSRTFIF